MRLYNFFVKPFQKERGGEELANRRIEDKREVIRKMDEDLLPNGWKKHETDTHVTYSHELSDSVSEVFRKIDQQKQRLYRWWRF